MRIVVVGLVTLALAGCVTGERQQKLQIGMDKQAVIRIMGHPTGDRVDGSYEALGWSNRLMSGWSWDRADYSVILKNGHVVEYGVGTVRQNGPPDSPVLVLVPLR
jgi:hypothetical protein